MAAIIRHPHVLGRSISVFGKISKVSSPSTLSRANIVTSPSLRPFNRTFSSATACHLLRNGRLLKDKVNAGPWLTGRSPLAYGAIGIRHKSTEVGGDIATEVVDLAGYIPDAPPLPVPEVAGETVTQALTALGEPTLASLGLCNYTPAGFMQAGLEMLHVTADLPWWGAIVAGTVCLRILVFPLVIMAQRNAANMSNHMPTVQRLQEKFTKARQSSNPLDAARSGDELMQYMKRNNVNPLKNMMVPFAQLPIFVSVFVGVRHMASLPVESLTTGGMMWFVDLTITDPYYALPVLTMATFLATIELGVDGVKADSMGVTLKYVMRAMPFVMLPLIINFPTAMLCYWFTSNIFSLTQVLFLKIPTVRTFFKIPELVKHDKSAMPKKKKFIQGFQDSMKNARLAAEIEDRHRQDALRFKDAGTAPLQKTYRHDPTKGKAIAAKAKK